MSSSKTVAQNPTTLLLNELEPGVMRTIVVMIYRMWDVHAATGRYLNTNFIVSDTQGNVMHCTAKGSIAHNFLRLKEGSIYLVKNFTVVPNKDEFRLVEIDELEPINNKYLIDVVGYVTNVGRITQTRTGSKTLDFYMANCRGQQIRVTLWGGLSDMLIEKRTCHVGLYPVVIIAITSSTLIVDDANIPLLMRLKTDGRREVDIIKKTENQAKMTKLSMEMEKTVQNQGQKSTNAKVQSNTEEYY
ncbi:reverse transcriptase [Tanacetum coccineum]